MLESYKELISAKAEIKQLKKQLEEAKSVVHAYWHKSDAVIAQCSNCGQIRCKDTYCSSCGALMDGKE